MALLGRINALKVLRKVDFGYYLDAGEWGDVLIPMRYFPENAGIGDEIDVFLYLDNEERPIATTTVPIAQVGDFAVMQVNAVNEYGAFLEWGITKELFLPFKEQRGQIAIGDKIVVHLLVDELTERIIASQKIDKYLAQGFLPFVQDQEVDVIVYDETPLGYKAVINQSHGGIFFKNEVFRPMFIGFTGKALIKKIREDLKIDLTFEKAGFAHFDEYTKKLEAQLLQHGGELAIGDKSDAQEIYNLLQMSKKNFKKAAGALFKQRRVKVEDFRITMLK